MPACRSKREVWTEWENVAFSVAGADRASDGMLNSVPGKHPREKEKKKKKIVERGKEGEGKNPSVLLLRRVKNSFPGRPMCFRSCQLLRPRLTFFF